jgi:uncharacterized protein (UPF0276 family)
MQRIEHLGHGVGLRHEHFGEIVEGVARADWFEVISENFMIPGGRPLKILEKARESTPVVMHGVSLNIGGTDPLNETYLNDLEALIRRFEPAWVSDHLCWGATGGHYAHDLLPLPYNEEALQHVVMRVRKVQDRLRRRILLENVSSYLTYRHSHMSEWTFLATVANLADCDILLDVNNIYVSAMNLGFSPIDYLEGVPWQRVRQFHLAGHSKSGGLLIDTHDHPVAEAVWMLYREAILRFGPRPTLIEWDDNLPSFEVLAGEAERARAIEAEVLIECSKAA